MTCVVASPQILCSRSGRNNTSYNKESKKKEQKKKWQPECLAPPIKQTQEPKLTDTDKRLKRPMQCRYAAKHRESFLF